MSVNRRAATGHRSRHRVFSVARVGAMLLRHIYLLQGSWPRLLELVYWPSLELLSWGFIQTYVNQLHDGVGTGGVLLGSLLLWEILFRAQLGFSTSFLEEIWSRNVANLLMSPLTRAELLSSLMSVGLVRMLLGVVPVSLLAMPFFGYNLWGVGLALGAFAGNLLLTGWVLAIVTSGLVLRLGLGAEILAWSATAVVMPLCAVFYPVSALPGWCQPIAEWLPPALVFEGLRALLFEHSFRADLMLEALAINGISLVIACSLFSKLVDAARRDGTILGLRE